MNAIALASRAARSLLLSRPEPMAILAIENLLRDEDLERRRRRVRFLIELSAARRRQAEARRASA